MADPVSLTQPDYLMKKIEIVSYIKVLREIILKIGVIQECNTKQTVNIMIKKIYNFVTHNQFRAICILLIAFSPTNSADLYSMPPDVKSMQKINELKPIINSIKNRENLNILIFAQNVNAALTSNNDVVKALGWWIIYNLPDSQTEYINQLIPEEPNPGPYSSGFISLASFKVKKQEISTKSAALALANSDEIYPIQRIELCKAIAENDKKKGIAMLEALLADPRKLIPPNLEGEVTNTINRILKQKKYPPRPIADDNYKLILSIIES